MCICSTIRLQCWIVIYLPEAIYCHGDGSDGRHVYHGHMVNCLRLSAVVIYCCHGDGSDGRRVCSKYHDLTHYNLMVIVINYFVVVIYCCTQHNLLLIG